MNKCISVLTRRLPSFSKYYLDIKFYTNINSAINTEAKSVNPIKTNLNSLQQKKRPIKKMKTELNPQQNSLKVIACSTAESYNLVNLKKEILNVGVYDVVDIAEDAGRDSLCLKAKYPVVTSSNENDKTRVIFLFNDGTCVFWNIEDHVEQNSVLNLVEKFSNSLYDEELIKTEIEMLTYSIDDKIENTCLNKNHISFSDHTNSHGNNLLLEKYTFSDAISTSVKLGILENKLENFIEKIEHISDDLKSGRKLKLTSQQVLQNTGELLALRHLINLRFDLLNTPDYYWDRENLENLYLSTVSFLDINKRTRVFNEKLNHCIDLMRILESNLNDKKHTRLEWFIILLIMIEAFFGFLSFMTK